MHKTPNTRQTPILIDDCSECLVQPDVWEWDQQVDGIKVCLAQFGCWNIFWASETLFAIKTYCHTLSRRSLIKNFTSHHRFMASYSCSACRPSVDKKSQTRCPHWLGTFTTSCSAFTVYHQGGTFMAFSLTWTCSADIFIWIRTCHLYPLRYYTFEPYYKILNSRLGSFGLVFQRIPMSSLHAFHQRLQLIISEIWGEIAKTGRTLSGLRGRTWSAFAWILLHRTERIYWLSERNDRYAQASHLQHLASELLTEHTNAG